MRYIPTNFLQSGHKLASDLVLNKNRIMLRRGIPLTDALIKRIEILGFQGLYIDDELSKGIYVSDVISEGLRIKTTNELRSFFSNPRTNKSHVKQQIKTFKKLVKNIVDEVLYDPQVMVNIIDLRTYDDYTYSHSLNVTVLSVVMGTVLGMDRKTLYELAMGALMHDTGKMFVDKRVLNKPERLTPEEFEEMKRHSELGFDYLCDNFDIPDSSIDAALHHHEQYDGKGYPAGLSGDDIPLFSRIICVADVYDALTSDRPYRKAVLPSDAIEYIMSGYNTMFDPDIVRALTKKVAPYPVGTCVKLSTGDIGIVVKNYESTSLRPVVKLIHDDKPSDECIDLANDRKALNITIQEIVNF